VINRGNGRRPVFLTDGDYEAFLKAMGHACIEIPMRVLGYCLMPNHFHLAVWPTSDGDLSRWMHWVLNTHVRRYHQHYHSCGHIWQGRFKSFPIQADDHLLTVLRYIERNPVRAGMVKRAEQWNWSSAGHGTKGANYPSWLAAGPVKRPGNWLEWVNRALTAAELESLRRCVNRQAPFGRDGWVERTAEELGLASTLGPRGRPRKRSE
jgi:putative transposase